jgi:glycerate dehydrogenase
MSSTTKKYKIVGLDSWVPLPDNLAIPHTTIQYPSTTPQQLPERVKDADIIIISGTPMTRAGIESAPNLKLIACNSTGTDHVDKQAAAERGVAVCRVPARNTDSVSEHAFALYFAVRRRVVKMHEFAMDGGRWGKESPLSSLGRPPRTNSEEALVVVGYGALGECSYPCTICASS